MTIPDFPREQIHIVDGEKFIRTPWTELQKVETFLNLTSVLTQDNFFFNGTKGFYCSRDIRSHGSWTCTRDKCLGRSKGRPKPPVKEETFQRLTEFFAPHNKMFYDMVGQVFEWPAYDWKSNLEIRNLCRTIKILHTAHRLNFLYCVHDNLNALRPFISAYVN